MDCDNKNYIRKSNNNIVGMKNRCHLESYT